MEQTIFAVGSRRKRSEITAVTTTTTEGSSKESIFTKLKDSGIEITISENIKFDVNYESIISLALLQFPALCLTIFGIISALRKHGLRDKNHALKALEDGLQACIISFSPYFLSPLGNPIET